MINKTLKELKQEFHYLKNESKLDLKSKEKIDSLEHVLTSTLDFYSSIDNKYINDVKKEILKKINSNLKVCMINKNRIETEMENYSLDFGNTKLDACESRINEYNYFLDNIDKMYIDILMYETNYNHQDMVNLYNDCVASINSKKENIEFLGQNLDNYSKKNNQKKLISKLYSYISDKDFINTFSYIVKIKKEIEEYEKNISDLKFIKNNKKYIEKYESISKSSSNDINYIIEKSYKCDSLNSKLKERNKNKILKQPVFNIFFNKLLKQIDSEELDINKRNIEYRKKERYLMKVSNYFSKNGFKIEELINYLWLDEDMIDNKINSYKERINEKEILLIDYVDSLSIEDKELYSTSYKTIENIITSLCDSFSNMVNIYILYILSNLNNIVNKNKEMCYNDYKVNDIVAKYKNDCNNRIIEIDTNKSIQKIKKLDII